MKHFVVFFEGGCFDIFCGGYLDYYYYLTWHLLESCFTALLRRAAFTAYFEATFFAAFFLGGAALWQFLVVDTSRHFFRGGCFATFLEGGGLERPLRSLHIKTITGCRRCHTRNLFLQDLQAFLMTW